MEKDLDSFREVDPADMEERGSGEKLVRAGCRLWQKKTKEVRPRSLFEFGLILLQQPQRSKTESKTKRGKESSLIDSA